MNRAASFWGIACLAAWIALGTGCAGRATPLRSASGSLGEGVAEEQATDPGSPTVAGAPAATAPAPDSTENSVARRDPHRTRRTIGWISLAIGAEAAIVAGVTSFMLVHEKSVLDANCDANKVCNADGIDAKGAISNTVPWNTGASIVAAVGVGVGTVLLLTSRSDSGKDTALTVSPTPAGASLGLRSQF